WDIDNKSITHRPDLWGHFGIAREVAALVGRELVFEIPRPAFTADDPLRVINEEPTLCPRYTAFTMDGISIAPSPLWMQVLLYHADQRPINNIVDFTNFVMMTLGNPLHAFDARQMGGNTIRIRTAREGEPMTTLDGEKHTLCAQDLVIADVERPVALAGIMGGLNSEVQPDTASLILESANFHAGRIRRSATRLGIRTESSARFEKSLDPRMSQMAAWYFADLVTENIQGARVSSRFYDEGAPLPEAVVIELGCDFVRDRLGTDLPDARIVEILDSLSFAVVNQGGQLTVTVPSFRATKDIGIPEDLVEEVGRIHGYGNIPPTSPMVQLEKPWTLPSKTVERRIRDTLALELGFNEVMTYSFDKLSNLEKAGIETHDALWLENPISKEEPVLRRTLLLNLIDAVKKNERATADIRLFETGRVFLNAGDGAIPHQPRKLAMVLAARGSKGDVEGELFFNMKYALERLASRLERGGFSLESSGKETLGHNWVHPVRSGDILIAGSRVGYMTVLHPAMAGGLQLKSSVVLADVNIDAIVALKAQHRLFEPLPRFPGIEHDISIIVEKKRTSAEVVSLLSQVDPLVASVTCVDMYEGEKFPGKRSLTFRILFAHPDRTLTQDEVQSIHEKTVHLVHSQLGGSILG
ncbi:phenylalanine--tRNA ligase subunit beta, partial [Myxococcota bacterium]|nr:phenylalanine--tRNA ligase subunit beta [Myxococcota bacterium]